MNSHTVSAVLEPRERTVMTAAVSTRPAPRPVDRRLSAEQAAELVAAAAAGDQQAWDSLTLAFASMIWAIARAHRLCHADAADVSQATWLALLEHLGTLRDPARVGAWLATTARRECLRVLRDGQRRVLLGDDTPEPESSDPAPGDLLVLSERDAALWRSFERLRPSDQALLRMLMADPRPSYEEIAAALDMPIGSIGPTRQRALRRLREELDNEHTLTLMID
jgi:RNA polymerase sigma factor (sigma-70 family)